MTPSTKFIQYTNDYFIQRNKSPVTQTRLDEYYHTRASYDLFRVIRTSLYNRLQGFATQKSRLKLGCCPPSVYRIIQQYQNTKAFSTTRTATRDGCKVTISYDNVRFNTLPAFGDARWMIKFYQREMHKGTQYHETNYYRLRYTKLCFFYNTDNWQLECTFTYVREHYNGSKWEIV